MSAEYTPTTETIERSYVGMSTSGMPILSRTADEERALARLRFRRWLAEHDREVRAKALEDAADAEADWSSGAWRSEEAETVVKLRKGLRRRAAHEREGRA